MVRVEIYLEGLTTLDGNSPWALPDFDLAEFKISSVVGKEIPNWAKSHAWYSARAEWNFKETNVLNPPELYQRIDALITCLRLFKPGYVCANPILIDIPSINGEHLPWIEGRSARDQQGGLAYGLPIGRLSELVKFGEAVIPLLSSEAAHSRTSPIFQFFNRGIDDEARNDYPMAIVDFVSCMEAVLLQGEFELSHRLSEMVALVTERSPERRRDRYTQCRELYRKRSKAIHGETVAGAMEAVNLAESLARYVVRFLLGYYASGQGKADLVSNASAVLFGQAKDFPIPTFEYVQTLAIPQSALE